MANLMLTGPGGARPDHYVALLEETRREAEGLESALAAKSRRLRDVRDRRTLGLSQVTASLSPGDALVAFARYEFRDQRGYAAFVLTPGRPPVAIDLGEGARIDDLVSAWYALASRDPAESASSESACDAAAHALSDGIWSPIVPSLFEATRIFVVPDGTLNEVNFAALPGKSGYLVEDGIAVEYLSAERDLAAPVSDIHGQGLLAMGGIDYAKSEDSPGPAADGATAGNPVRPTLFRGRLSDCTAIRNIRFVPLPGSKKELDDLTQLWRGSGRPASLSRVIIGKAATESALKKAAAGRSILHLATHAFVEGECGGAGTRGVGGMETVAEGTTQSAVTDNPFRVCGLAFAGANVRNSKPPDDDDGVLTAEEVTSLDLSGVDWAVLSACDTGRGEVVSGEGLLGLRRAFQVAGARTLITSLWPVGDESTRGWMDRLYRARLGRHETTIDAVRSANLDMLKDRRARHESIHPFYWAGFVASGDWR